VHIFPSANVLNNKILLINAFLIFKLTIFLLNTFISYFKPHKSLHNYAFLHIINSIINLIFCIKIELKTQEVTRSQ